MFDFCKLKPGKAWIVEKDSAEYFQAQIDELSQKIIDLERMIDRRTTIYPSEPQTFNHFLFGLTPKAFSVTTVLEKVLDHLGLKVEEEPATEAKAVLKKIPAKRKR